MASRRSAKVICSGGCFWITPKQFWALVREDVITFMGEHPLHGRYRGREEDFLISVNRLILNLACKEHMQAALAARRARGGGR